jgi:RNA ligase
VASVQFFDRPLPSLATTASSSGYNCLRDFEEDYQNLCHSLKFLDSILQELVKEKMELQQYLRAHGLEKLIADYSIKSVTHKQYPHLISLKYSQIDSPMGEKIVQQCRGIVLDRSNNWEIISYPYDKFFNYGEGNGEVFYSASIDWSTAKVYEKLDGSLMTLYFYDGAWRVQSSGTPDAAGEVSGFGFSFADLFWRVWQELGYQLPTDSEYCFMFELVTKYNRVVVQPKLNQLILHGVRHVPSRQEADPQVWTELYGWELVKTYPLTDWTTVIEAAKDLNPMESEGYIVCDRAFNRVKIKSPQYVAIAHLREGFSARRMLQILTANEGEEFLTYFPEWTELYQTMKVRYLELVAEIEAAVDKYSSIEVQKDFALAIKNLPYSGMLFSLRRGKAKTVRECLQNTTVQKLEELMGVDYTDLGL